MIKPSKDVTETGVMVLVIWAGMGFLSKASFISQIPCFFTGGLPMLRESQSEKKLKLPMIQSTIAIRFGFTIEVQ